MKNIPISQNQFCKKTQEGLDKPPPHLNGDHFTSNLARFSPNKPKTEKRLCLTAIGNVFLCHHCMHAIVEQSTAYLE